jgi:hypothetical protein
MNRRGLLTAGAGVAAGAVCTLVAQRPSLAAFGADAFTSNAVSGGGESWHGQGVSGNRLADLNPDRMWPVYRRYHLLIVGQRDDERSGVLTTAVVDVLLHYLPSSRAQLVSAADARRIGVLIATNQQDVAIMQAGSAEALFLAKPPFADVHEAPLRIIVSFGSHVLVCRPDFKARHAYLVAQTLAAHAGALPAAVTAPKGVVPAHRGARAFFAGEGMPND